MVKQTAKRSVLLGAAFLMATSSIGPGFLTQTTTFTEQLLASFGFAILISIIIDIGVQMNIWQIIAVSEKRAQDIANDVLPDSDISSHFSLSWAVSPLILETSGCRTRT